LQIVGHTDIYLSKDARSHDREISCVIIYLNATLNAVGEYKHTARNHSCCRL